MDACLHYYWLLALNGFTVHDSLTSNAEITSLEFSLIGTLQDQRVAVCLEVFLGYDPLLMMFTSAPVSMSALMGMFCLLL